MTTNTSGTVVARIAYFPFGAARPSSGTLGTDKKFTGQRLDQTGLYYSTVPGTTMLPSAGSSARTSQFPASGEGESKTARELREWYNRRVSRVCCRVGKALAERSQTDAGI